MVNALRTVHVVLHLGHLADGKLEHARNAQDVRENKAAETRADSKAGGDDQNADDKDDKIADGVKTDA